VFRGAGIYGLLVLFPQYFMEARIGREYPPPVTHPEHFYGFLGIALAWQIAFLMIAHEPQRLRPMMLPAIVEKITFGVAATLLFAAGRIPAAVQWFAGVDLLLAALFALAYVKTRLPEVAA